MRRRDIIAVLFCVGAVILASLNESPVTIQGSFFLPYGDSSGRQFPRPLLADLNGDGKVELLAVGPADTLSVYPTSSVRSWGDQTHFVKFKPLAASSHTSNIVAFAVGPIDRANESDSHAVAVVSDDYRLELMNNELRHLWSASVIGDAAAITINPSYAAVTINSERIFKDDMGTVVVAMPVSDDQHIIACFDGATGDLRWRRLQRTNLDSASEAQRNKAYDFDKFKFTAADIEKEPPQLQTALTTFPNLLHIALPHYTQQHSWTIHMEAAHLYTQKSKKKRAQLQMIEDAPAAKNQGKISAKPDEDFDQEGADAKRRALKRRRIRGPKSSDDDLDDLSDYADDFGRQIGQAKAGRRARQKKRRDNNVLIIHLPEMVLVVHYYTGRVLAVLDALRKGSLYEDLDNDGTVDEISLEIGGTVQRQFSHHGFEEVARCHALIHRNWPSVSADEMIEVPLCGHSAANFLERLSVPFTVHDSDAHAKEMKDSSKLHGYAGDKKEVASAPPLVLHSVSAPTLVTDSNSGNKKVAKGSTVDSRVLFFLSTGEIAVVHGHQAAFRMAKTKSALFEEFGVDEPATGGNAARNNGNQNENNNNKRPLSPMEQRRERERERYRSIRNQMQEFERNAQWNTDDKPLEMKPWIIRTPSEFNPSALSSEETTADKFGHLDGMMKPFPHIVSYNFHTKQDLSRDPVKHVASNVAQHALAVGSQWMTLVNVHTGTPVTTAKLEEVATGPAIVVDFSGDGVNDIIVPTSEGYYGYVVKRHAATSAVGTVMAVVLALFALLVGARFVESGSQTESVMASASSTSLGATFGDSRESDVTTTTATPNIAVKLRSGKRSTD